MKNKNQIIIGYILYGSIWVIFSDQLMLMLTKEMNTTEKTIAYGLKEFVFVLLNAVLLNYLIRVYNKKRKKSLSSLLKSLEDSKEKEARISRQHGILTEVAWINAHAIRKPVASILGLSALTHTTTDPAEKREYYLRIESCVKELDLIMSQTAEKLENFNEEVKN